MLTVLAQSFVIVSCKIQTEITQRIKASFMRRVYGVLFIIIHTLIADSGHMAAIPDAWLLF